MCHELAILQPAVNYFPLISYKFKFTSLDNYFLCVATATIKLFHRAREIRGLLTGKLGPGHTNALLNFVV